MASVFFILCVAVVVYLYALAHGAMRNNSTHDERRTDDASYPIERSVPGNINSEVKGAPTESATRSINVTLQAQAAENTVEHTLRQLEENRYFVFRDLIIPSSSKSMSLTQIDHVVVSRKGIFCIETKSNNGNIYGYSRSASWKQYLGNSGKPYSLNSPFRQNYHHVKSLEMLLEGKLKATIHSYIAFPNARKVVVDGVIEDMSPAGIMSKIKKHQKDLYDYADVESIAKILAHAGTLRDQLRGRHMDEVRTLLDAKVSGSLKLS